MILLDTSVWIEAFRRKNPLRLETLLPFEEIVTCLPIIQEVLQGFRDERPYRLAREAFLSMPVVESPLRDQVFLEAVDLYRTAKTAGFTPRSSVDCVIAICALRHDLEVVHRDRDYEVLSRVSRLRERRL